MKKVNYLQFREDVEATGKTYFNKYELKKFYHGTKGSFKVLLSNWIKKRLIYSLSKGFYAFNLTKVDYLHLAHEFDRNSYISFEYALYLYGLIDQVPSVITLATKKRSRVIKSANWTFEFTHLKDDLFFGYELKNKVYMAIPEKALADLIYLISRGKRIFEFDTLEKKKIDKKKLHEILEKFPLYTQRLANQYSKLKRRKLENL